jgi:aminoglycoside/choline kinase family phosphotransferase
MPDTLRRDAAPFLAAAGWGAARRAPLAGDASLRRYERLTSPDGATAVLMDADPATGEDVRPFLRIARHLAALGLSAPRILAEDAPQGFLLLEDLGDDLFARVAARDPAGEPQLYAAAAAVLGRLHAAPPPSGLAAYDTAAMVPLALLALDWYLPGTGGGEASPLARAEAAGRLAEALERHAAPARPVLVLRDFHAENLIWLPDRDGPARVGLLDFQDARLGHPAYDLVSLLEDARRDVAPEAHAAARAAFLDATSSDAAGLDAALAVLGAQRNLRILGVFARLSLHFGKPGYVALIPRVWRHLQRDLAHPALAPLAAVLGPLLPEPAPARLDRLRDLCGTRPTL